MASGSRGGGTSNDEPKLKWMYDGPKSDINREDYLLGKKIDKSFEIVSDVVIRDTAEERQKELFAGRATGINKPTPSSSNFKESVLQTDIVRKEDPLVMLKLREEQKKRAMLENPLTQMRIKRVLKEAFEKEKSKKQKRRDSATNESSSDSDDSSEHRSHRRHHGEHSQRSGHTSRRRDDHSHHHHNDHRRQDRHSPAERSPKRSPRHCRRRDSSESPHHRDHRKETERRDRHGSPIQHRRGHSGREERETAGKRRLTADEMKARLEAMTANAKWRDDYREENLHRATEELKREVEESQRHQNSAGAASLLRPMFNAAAEASSVEKRIQSNRMRVQRSHDYMEKAFARK